MNALKHSLRWSLAAIALSLSFGLVSNGCRTATGPNSTPIIIPPVNGSIVLSSAGVINVASVTTNGNGGDFDLDLFVVDSGGNIVSSLDSSSFGLSTDLGPILSQLNVTSLLSSALGPYSAELLLDQTGSIRTTDPFNLRLEAAELFLKVLRPGDEVQLSTFQDSLHDGIFTHTCSDFTTNGPSLIPAVEALKYTVGGGTPLYDAMYIETDSLAAGGKNANKILVVFTDGEDNESMNTALDAINYASSLNVKVFAVALKTGFQGPLSQIASKTGGSIMHATDAKQMVPYFGALGKVMHGGTQYYRTHWHIASSGYSSLAGQTVNATLNVKKDHSTIAVPFQVTFPY